MRHQPGIGFFDPVARPKQVDPDLHVLALRFTDLTLGPLRKMRQVAVLDTDEIRLIRSEVEMKVDEPVQCRIVVAAPAHDRSRAGQQASADADEQFDQQRLFVRGNAGRSLAR